MDIKKYTVDKSNALRNVTKQYQAAGQKTIKISNNVITINAVSSNTTEKLNAAVVSFGTNVREISPSCFYACNKLTSVYATAKVREIGDHAFCKCTSLQYASLLNYPRAIFGDNAFEETKLQSATVDAQPTELASVYIGESLFKNCTALKEVTLKNEAYLTKYMLYGASSLSKLNLESCKKIDEYALYGCASLGEVDLPLNCGSIGQYALAGCSQLRQIAFNPALTSVASFAFQNDTSLPQVDFTGTAVTALQDNVYSGCSSLKTIKLSKLIGNVNSFSQNCFSGTSDLSVYLNGITDQYISENRQRFIRFGSSKDVTYISQTGKKYIGTQQGILRASTAFIICVNTSTTSVNRFHGALLWRDILQSYVENYSDDDVYWLFDVVGSYNENVVNIDDYKGRKNPTNANLKEALQSVIDKKYDNLVFFFEDHGSSSSMITQGSSFSNDTLWQYLVQMQGQVFLMIACCYSGAQTEPTSKFKTAHPDWNKVNAMFICASVPSAVSYRSSHACRFDNKSSHQSNDLTYAVQKALGAYDTARPIVKKSVKYKELYSKYTKIYGTFDQEKNVFDF